MSKLAIAAETEEDRYDTTTRIICYDCNDNDVDSSSGKLSTIVEGVMKALTFSRREEVKAWEQEYVPCEHTLCLSQAEATQLQSQGSSILRKLDSTRTHSTNNYDLDLAQCSMCDLKENLWLCLECGNLGCGRSQFGGVGGNSHGLAHADSSSHGVAVKLGSITAEGSADIFCYKCNEERIDPDLATHLAHWGINIADREKTEKSLVEMQIEQNLKWDFSMTSADGQELTPLFGPGLTGLRNLGNSCYLSSSLQCLFSLPEFEKRYFRPLDAPPLTVTPAEDLETQLRKIGDGIHSGRYAVPDPDSKQQSDSSSAAQQKGLLPAMFKHLIGRGHEEFSTMRQQDAFELLQHLFKLISRSKHEEGLYDPVDSFRFAVEQRLQCLSCRKVRYRVDEHDNISVPVPARRIHREKTGNPEIDDKPAEFQTVTLKECLDVFTGEEIVELTCPACGSKDGFRKQSLFKTFPQNLAVNARRFELVNWVPTKLNIPVEVQDRPFDMSNYLSKGIQDGEEPLPDDEPAQSSVFVPNTDALNQLIGMGFPEVRSQKALHATGNSDAEAALNWLFGHMEDPDIDVPVDLGNPGASNSSAGDPEKVAQLGEMGIEPAKARKALQETGGDMMRAVDWVFSHPEDTGDVDGPEANAPRETPGSATVPAEFQLQSIICHKGASVHSG